MTDSSMNFGPAWIRNLRSEGTTGGGTGTAGTRYQLAEHRYGREEMLVLFDKTVKPPPTLAAFKALYSEQTLVPLALLETSEEEQRVWQSRPTSIGGPNRGRGVSLERGGRTTRGRGNYPTYGRTPSAYDSGWGNGEQSDWSPRKDYNTRSNTTDNWRRVRSNEDDEGWRSMGTSRSLHEKWGRSTSWRGEGDIDERNGPPERGGRQSWHENNRNLTRRSWENEDHLPEWVNENPTEGGGTFDERGAFHGSDDEQISGDNKTNKKELQKSASQQQIGNRNNHPPILSTSKSAISLTKTEHDEKQSENLNERDKETSKMKEGTSPEPEKPPSIADKSNTDDESDKSGKREEEPRSITTEKTNDNSNSVIIGNNNNTAPPQHPSSTNIDKVEEEFARMQEDLVLKLVIDEETPKTAIQNPSSSSTTTVVTTTTNFDVTNTVQAPPPNLVPSVPTVPPPPLPPSQDKWYYQDPQGTRQGPFLNVEMAEWYKAGYFSNQLRVMRECDERYFLLGELINLCGGDNPFLSNIRFPILKNETPTKLNDDMLSYQLLSQLAFKQQISMRNLTEPWSALTLQQQELAAQRLLLQQQQQQQPPPPQQLPHDLQYMQQSAPPANPLMFMINQMQQSNKLHGSMLVDKPINSSSSSNSVPNPLDTLPVQLGGGIHSLQNRIPPQNLHNHILPTNLSTSLPSDSLNGGLPGLQTNNLPTPGLSTLPNLHSALPTGLNRPTSHSPIDQLPPPTNQENDPITNFLKQFHQQKQRAQMPLDGSMWHKPTNQFNVPQATGAAAVAATTTTTQWAQQPDVPLSMWDLQPPPLPTSLSSDNQSIDNQQADLQQSQEIEKQQHQQQQQQQQRSKEDTSPKELKRKKEIDEKQVKKNAEEKRKQEQRRHEAEKKAAEEKRKKEEERIRKELERAKKEAEDKRMRELEEKRRLKEQRKAEEEAKKKSEELKKQEEEKLKREAKEREERKQAETRLIQNQAIKTAKAAPWSQSNSNQGMSLTDIQKAEKERRAQEAALMLKQQQLQEQQQQQQQQQAEKSSGIQLNWAKKPIEPKHVKSFAEIQAEEQERLAKMTAEARLAAQQREKEIPASNTNSIWNGQSLTWANATTTSQWSSNAATGFWDDILVKSTPKPSTVPKSSSTSAMSSVVSKQTPPQSQPTSQKQTKTKIKKDEQQKSVISNNNNNNNSNSNNNNSANDEFTNWCYKTLSTISTNVDIPTFVSFLRDIESAYDVRDYCKEYLGDSAATQQFATNFLEKRRSFKPKTNAHKDDMCSPAPAITPSTQHSTEFQEVKGKNKKNKKSKMLKVDSRILGFQVTSAPDRINVGDRDYGDNS